MSKLLTFVAPLLLMVVPSGAASAGIISEILSPDIAVAFLKAKYDDSSDLLELDGFAVTLENPGGILQNIFAGLNSNSAGTFSLDATIDESGEFTSGDYEIRGVLNQADAPVTLLKGTLTEAYTAAFESNGQLEFRATADSGTLSNLFDDLPRGIGIRVHNVRGFSFAGSFQNFGGFNYDYLSASADIGRPVPEPSSVAAFSCVFVMGCVGIRRRKKNRFKA